MRFALLIGLAGGPVNIVASAIPGGLLAILLMVLVVLAALVAIVGEFAKYYYLEKLAMRIPDPQLARRAYFLRWAIAVSYGVVGVGGAAAGVAVAAGLMPAPGAGMRTAAGAGMLVAFGCAFAVAMLCLFIFWIMALVLQYRMRNVLREHAQFARDAWRRAAAGQTP